MTISKTIGDKIDKVAWDIFDVSKPASLDSYGLDREWRTVRTQLNAFLHRHPDKDEMILLQDVLNTMKQKPTTLVGAIRLMETGAIKIINNRRK